MAFPLALALIAAFLLTGGRSRTDLSEEQIAKAHSSMDDLEKKGRSIRQAVDEGKRESFTLEVSQDVINVRLLEDANLAMAFQDKGIEDPFVEINGAKLVATGTKRIGGIQAKMSAELVPAVGADGRLRITVIGASLGRIGVPASMVQRLGDSVAERLTDTIGKDKITLTYVKIEGNEVVLKGEAG